MASPFPGMDPYLEEPAEWGGFHAQFIVALSNHLADLVSPTFIVRIEERVYITTPENRDVIVPDIFVIRGPAEHQPDPSLGTVTAPTIIEPLPDPVLRYRSIEIRDRLSRELVTLIEVLSPINKAAGTHGRSDLVEKRRTLMASNIHWIELDLLRAGERPPELANKSDYYALLKRGEREAAYEVWFIDLRDRLPTIAVPLRPPFADVPLDLQAVFDTVYSRAHYADSVDYTRRPPSPLLAPADATWAASRISAWWADRTERTNS
jgi:hypothetical protein